MPETAAEPFTGGAEDCAGGNFRRRVLCGPVRKAEGQGEPKQLGGSGHLIYATRLASYRVSAGAFFQVNRHLTDELVDIVTRSADAQDAADADTRDCA